MTLCVRVSFAALALIFGLAIAGCLVIPIPFPGEQALGKRVSEDTIASINSGRTTKAEILSLIGQPNVVWEDERIVGYHWVALRKGIVLIGVAGRGGELPFETRTPHSLLIQFDEHDVVLHVTRKAQSLLETYREHTLKWRDERDRLGRP